MSRKALVTLVLDLDNTTVNPDNGKIIHRINMATVFYQISKATGGKLCVKFMTDRPFGSTPGMSDSEFAKTTLSSVQWMLLFVEKINAFCQRIEKKPDSLGEALQTLLMQETGQKENMSENMSLGCLLKKIVDPISVSKKVIKVAGVDLENEEAYVCVQKETGGEESLSSYHSKDMPTDFDVFSNATIYSDAIFQLIKAYQISGAPQDSFVKQAFKMLEDNHVTTTYHEVAEFFSRYNPTHRLFPYFMSIAYQWYCNQFPSDPGISKIAFFNAYFSKTVGYVYLIDDKYKTEIYFDKGRKEKGGILQFGMDGSMTSWSWKDIAEEICFLPMSVEISKTPDTEIESTDSSSIKSDDELLNQSGSVTFSVTLSREIVIPEGAKLYFRSSLTGWDAGFELTRDGMTIFGVPKYSFTITRKTLACMSPLDRVEYKIYIEHDSLKEQARWHASPGETVGEFGNSVLFLSQANETLISTCLGITLFGESNHSMLAEEFMQEAERAKENGFAFSDADSSHLSTAHTSFS